MPPHQKEPEVISLRVGSKNFELMAIQDKVFEYRKNQQMSLDNVLYTEQIYSDAKEGKEAPVKDLKELGDNPIAKILMEGHAELSTEERRKMVEQKTTEIIGYLHANCCDLQKKPVLLDRIKLAIGELKGASIDPNEAANVEALELIKKLEKTNILFLQSAGIEATLTVSYANLSKTQNLLKKAQASCDDEEYVDNGVAIKFMVSPGTFDHLICELERECKGAFDLKVAQQGNCATDAVESSSKKKQKKDGK